MKASNFYFQIFAFAFSCVVFVHTKAESDTTYESNPIENEVRCKRPVRPPKSYEFKESDGASPGTILFYLDKTRREEEFKLESANHWVTVDLSGAVRVKEPWDYDVLEINKTLYFWVVIIASNVNDTERQSISIRIIDVNDEQPFFTNQPLPMQAVVRLNAAPGTCVFKLQAIDRDTNHSIHYFLLRDRTGGRFEIDEHSGEVRTRGNEPFHLDKEYVLYVKAEDHNGPMGDRQFQSTKEERLSIMGGRRPPQFYMPKYEAVIPENQKKDSDIIKVKAKSFADREIRYTLRARGKGSGKFNIGPTSGVVKLAGELDYEDLRQPKQYFLIVTATEASGGFSTSVELIVNVTDVNDNAPRFEFPVYQAHNIDEDLLIGTSILRVSATDADSGKNAEVVYSLDKDEFSIDDKGIIYSKKRLDADDNCTYQITVTATDKGDQPMNGSTIVLIFTENKNDEPPKFTLDVYTANVDESATSNTLVTTVLASDKDGDNILFEFDKGNAHSGMFQINERTGVIRLNNGPIILDKNKYELNVTAKDDGSCCLNGHQTTHTTTALVFVFITDVNNNKPIFEECQNYAPIVEEGFPRGTVVEKVKATDRDKGLNGQVRYSFVPQPNQKETKFTIDEITGEIRTNKVFDREGVDGRFVSLTVKAVDSGTTPLEGVCSFKVEITDINDNPPLFDRQEYEENVKQDTQIGTNILRVHAYDEDFGNNGSIKYDLTALEDQSDSEYFVINPNSGWITLKKPLTRPHFHLIALAIDKGVPELRTYVNVFINVVDRANNYPVWDQLEYGTISIKENIEVGSRVISIKASSAIADNPTVFYTLIRGSTGQTNKRDTFYLKQRTENGETYADIHVNYPLDYELIQQYNLTVRAENNGIQQLASETNVYILLDDVNDEAPLFIERAPDTILEGLPPGTRVTQVEAVDRDKTHPNNKVYYKIESINGSDTFFNIDRETGEIHSKVEFDREIKQSYAILVTAYDGSPSARPNYEDEEPNSVTKYLRIEIGDKNDNPPYFDQVWYEAEVNEDEEIKYTVITVTAEDKDESSKIRYEITRGNNGGAFGVNNETGEIYVSSTLDYETKKEYKLRLAATDNLNENYTTVFIRIKDVNDNPPVFDHPTYETRITEEDNRNLPKRILQITANDGDNDRPHDMKYFLTGQGTDDMNRNFAINSTSGEIYVLKPLDRDYPNGRSQWKITVFAQDESVDGLIGFTEVVVILKDINDNTPFFPHSIYTASVRENDTAGLTVMTMTAKDYDDPSEGSHAILKYFMEQNQVNELGQLIFSIDKDTGVITTAVCCLDRETNPEFMIKVVAMDGGGLKGTAAATIKLNDVNDMPPEFTKKEWFVEVDETENDQVPKIAILNLSVFDGDLFETNRFNYTVVNNTFGADKFTMITNLDGTGSLKVVKPLDFEDLQQRHGFNLTISVSDRGGKSVDPYHVDYANVIVRLRDINDNKPEFKKPNIEVSVFEDSRIGTSLATFHATDADQGGQSKVRYMIDRASNEKQQFQIDQNGTVRIERTLDREDVLQHQIKILAVDDGVSPRTATATLTVVVNDMNDNAPRFLKDYRPVIYENDEPKKVIEILATDDDDRSKGNGAPFLFRIDPNAHEVIKTMFDLQYDNHGENGDGMAIIYSKQKFDREVQKEYLVPILIKDSGISPMIGTSTLTVVIGDRNNNNETKTV